MNKKTSSAVAVMLAVLIAAACITTVMMLSASARHESATQAQDAQIESLQNQLTQQRAANDRRTVQVADQATGTDPARISTDSAAIQDLVRSATTWSSGATYDAVRARMQRVYRLSPNGSFMTALLPPEPHRVDDTGKAYYYLDSINASSTPVEVPVTLARVVGVNYVYTVPATLAVGGSPDDGSDSSGSTPASATTAVLITVTVDPTGHVLDAQAVAAGAPSREAASSTLG